MTQDTPDEGVVELINSDYSTNRFPFSYSWWSAYGWQRHCLGDAEKQHAESMKLIDQANMYQQCGEKIKADLLGGNAVVLFAYGLSGSGKTFTVFGPDAIDAPEAWFKHDKPHALWGIFPRLAYEIFEMKQDGWKVTLKYFQNVVDTVRDLMSSTGEEQHYKNGMRKDPDGFMDIEWCQMKTINSWNHLREEFQKANARKAIAPTQFNPMSTRGHCIMVLEVEMPNPDNPEIKLRGRVYVCDLAGTEPAGDIFYAQYEKKHFDDGSFEYKLLGAHPDSKKSKELQDQGKKINLSLSEMAQFFMKMAEAILKKKLKPGMSLPGCNSFFLCKYLKDTMLQARTYLFCAIRPEVTYHKYTFATLGFAKNASVIKLQPKKATVACSAAERKLMAELDAMKQLVEQLRAQQASGGNDDMVKELQAKLAAKQDDLENEMGTDGDSDEKYREEYAKKGITLAADATDCEGPYFINLDEDAFRSNRFMYILKQEISVFGSRCDFAPPSMSVIKNHCSVRYDEGAGTVTLIAGKGDTYHNGKSQSANSEVSINVLDRIGMGDQLMMFRWPAKEATMESSGSLPSIMSPEDAVDEFQEAIMNARRSGGGGDNDEERRKLQEEREKWEKEKEGLTQEKNAKDYERAMAAVDNTIMDLLPKIKEAKDIVDLFNRVTMTFDIVLEKAREGNIPRVKITVKNSKPKYHILIDQSDFLPKLSLLKDELMKVQTAVDDNREYDLPERHDPLYLMFDNDYLLGSSTSWPEYLLYNMDTDEEERMQEIKNAAVPYNTVGLLDVRWTPLGGPDEADWDKPPIDITDESELIGKPWTYKIEIIQASDLPVFCEMAYVQYTFLDEIFTTEAVQQTTYSPKFEYSHIHHVPKVTEDMIEKLKGALEMKIHVTQHISAPPDQIGTKNNIVVDSVKSGEAKGYEATGVEKPKSEADMKNEQLLTALEKANAENIELKQRIQELELKLSAYESNGANAGASSVSGVRAELEKAKVVDGVVNN